MAKYTYLPKKHSNLDVNEKEKLRKHVKETEVTCNNFNDEKKKI